MKSLARSLRPRGATPTILTALTLGAAAVLVVPAAANAASAVSQGNGQLVSVVTPAVGMTDPTLAGASAVNASGNGAVTTNTPLSAAAVTALTNIQANGTKLFGAGGTIQLSGMAQAAQANNDGSSTAFSGVTASAPSGWTVTPGPSVGSPESSSDVEVKLGSSSAAVGIDAGFGGVAATAVEPAGGTPTGTFNLASGSVVVSGTDFASAVAPITTDVNSGLTTFNNFVSAISPSQELTYPYANNTVTVTLPELLSAANVSSVASLPAGTDLLHYLPAAIETQVTNTVQGLLAQMVKTANADNQWWDSLLVNAINSNQPAVQSALATFNTTLSGSFATDLTSLGQVKVGIQSTSTSGSLTETAMQVNEGANGTTAQVNLASATVGPNAGVSAAPIISEGTAGVVVLGAAALLAMLGAAAVLLVRRRRSARSTSEGNL